MTTTMFNADRFDDHRARRLFDIFPELKGQVTVSEVAPYQFSGWHRHEKQFDVFSVIEGELKVGVINTNGASSVKVLTRGESLKIPSFCWHCYTSGPSKATLVYYLSRKHDETDEFRATEEEIFEQFKFRMERW